MSPVEADLESSNENDLFDWPLFGLQDDVRPALADALGRNAPAVLATLYGVVGAAPRGGGAQMVFADGAVAGFLSGGCIEADLAIHAKRVLAQGRPERVIYGDGGPLDIRLPCGSRIDVLLEPIRPKDIAVMRLLELAKERRPAIWLSNGEDRICVAVNEIDSVPETLRAVLAASSGGETCGYVSAPFAAFRAYAPPVRLMVIGGDPIALAVVKLAVELGLETTLIRPKGPQACPIPGVQYSRSDVQTVITARQPDPWTAIAILTHDVEQEHAALTAALASEAGYIGALGSRRRVPERNARLVASGVASTEVERVHAPIGLPIGGKSSWEIAISIIAEIVSVMGTKRNR